MLNEKRSVPTCSPQRRMKSQGARHGFPAPESWGRRGEMNKKGSFSLVRAPRGFLSVSRHSRFASALLAMVFCACSTLSWAQTSGDTTEPPCENLPPDDPSYCGNPGDLNDTAPGVRPESEYERRIRSSEQLAPLS